MNGWKEIALLDVAVISTGFPFDGHMYGAKGVRVIRGENIGDGFLHWENGKDKRWSLPWARSEEFSLKEKDIVLSMDGCIGKNKAMVRDCDLPLLIAQRVACIRAKDNAEQLFLKFVIFSKSFEAYLTSIQTGSVIQHVSMKQIGDYRFPLPPLSTQRRIASVLSALDDKIELNNRINANLEAQAQALFRSWFVDFEPWGGVMPGGWREGKLGDWVEIKRGGSPRPIHEYIVPSGYRWLKISDVTSLNSPFVFQTKEFIKESGLPKTVYLRKGALVLSNSATPGIPKILCVDSCIHDGWLYFPKSAFSIPYLYLFFKYIRQDLVNLGNGSIFTNLKTDILKEYKVVKPDAKTLEDFDSQVQPIFDKQCNNERQTQALIEIRDTLLPKLMSGEIDVSRVEVPA